MPPLRVATAVLLAGGAALGSASRLHAGPDKPNVLVVITDDQGFGDLGAHGNPVVKTPHLDRFAGQSVWLKNFHSSPVCSPTRAALLTGLYNYRSGVVDTFVGRSMMRPGVPTLAEQLAKAGYRTGLFGKWHLGDHYPLRPEDRGFGQTLWHQGGGLAQPADHPDQDPKTAYFDPILTRNGKEEKTTGYCTDVFADAAVKFLTANPGTPFFAYVAFNAPHDPFQVPDGLADPYRKLDLSPAGFPKVGQPWAGGKATPDATARAYAMIENVDGNFGRLLKALDDAKSADNTLVVFLTDNGPGGPRWNAGLRARKGTVYDGGTRVPCYARWPAGGLVAGRVVEQPTAHIDWAPTVRRACGAEAPAKTDGRDLFPLLRGDRAEWPARTLFTQWHRGDVPEKGRAFAARGPRLKLVQAAGVQSGPNWTPKYELFDVPVDPFEQTDLAAQLPAEVDKLKAEYEAWFADVTKDGFDPPRIVVGSDKENPVRLSLQDRRVTKGAGWGDDGEWLVTVDRPGRYELTVRSRAEFVSFSGSVTTEPQGPGPAFNIKSQGFMAHSTGSHGPPPAPLRTGRHEMELERGAADMRAWVEAAGKKRGAEYLEVKYLGPAK